MNRTKHFSCLVSILTAAVVLLVPYSVNGADQTEKLINILQQKGIITKDEAAALEKEVKGEQPDKKDEAAVSKKDSKGEKPEAKGDWTKKVEVGYDKGAYIKTIDDKFSLKMNVGLQGIFSYSFLDEREDTSTFDIRRARLYFSGNAFYPWLTYYVQLTLEDSDTSLRDAYVEASRHKELTPRYGQFKVPFDREFLTSAFNLQLIDRSIANSEFNLGRDIGIQLAGFPLGDLFEYRFGVFNGSGANQSNQNNEYMYVGRLVFTPFGPYPYSQAALDTPEKPLLAIGVAGAYMPDLDPGGRETLAGRLGNTAIVPVTSDVTQLTADIAFKYLNFSLEGAFYWRSIDPGAPTNFGKEDATGYFAQAGYFLVPKKFEIAGRYSWLNPDNPVSSGNNDQQEFTGGFSYYFAGHPLKVQANYTYQKTDIATGDRNDHIVKTQFTLLF